MRDEVIFAATLVSGVYENPVVTVVARIPDGRRVLEAPVPYGFSHRPPDGSDVVVGQVEGNPDNNQALIVQNPSTRVLVLEPGEVALNTANDDPTAAHRVAPQRIVLTNGGEVIISADETVHVRAGSTTFTIRPNERVEIDGGLFVNGGIQATSEIRSDTEVVASGVRLTRHRHSGVDTGPGQTGRPI